MIKVTLTRDDIVQGLPCDSDRCPISLAMLRHGWIRPLTGMDRVYHGPTWRRKVVYLSRRVTNWITRFDRGKPVSPFSFTLHLTTS